MAEKKVYTDLDVSSKITAKQYNISSDKYQLKVGTPAYPGTKPSVISWLTDGISLSQGQTESSGIYMDGDKIAMWCPFDDQGFIIYDEDDGSIKFRIDGSSNIYEGSSKLSDKYLGKTATAADSTKLNGQAASYYLDYNNFTNTPTIPTVNNGTLTIQKNGTNVATFTANQSGNSTANISVPVNFSDLSSRGEAFLSWGGQSLNSSVSPIGMSLSSEHSANRLAFINGDALYVEYSSDNGSTWTDYGASKNNKSEFCTTSYSFNIGSNSSSTTRTTSMKTRITLTAQNGTNGYVYTSPKKMLIRMSTACGVSMLVEYRTGANYKSGGSWSTLGTYTVSGWSGWNDIPLILGTLGGSSSQTGNNWQLRMTFSVTSVSSSSPTYAQVIAMRIFGDNGWTTTSNMGNTGHLYSYDISQNATFPAGVKATSFTENGTLLSSKYLQLSGGTLTGALKLTSQSSVWNTNNIVFTSGETIGGNTSGGLGLKAVSQIYFRIGSTTEVSLDSAALYPSTSEGNSLGTSSYQWNNIYGKVIYENGTALSSKYLGISATAADSTKLNGQAASYYLDYNNFTNTPTIPTVIANPSGTATTTLTKLQVGSTVYSVGGSAPSNMVTTDTTQTITGTKTLTKPLHLGNFDNNGELYLYFVQNVSDHKVLYSDSHSVNIETQFGGGTYYDPANPSDLKLRVEGKAYYVHSSSSTPTNNDEIATKGDLPSFSAKGSTTKPVYLSETNTFAECSTYAGGTAVTLNGTSTAGSTASFYAPTTYGTSGYELVAAGTNTSPVWKQPSFYTTCSTAASTVAKTASIINFKLTTGVMIGVNFTNSHTSSSSATLNINDTGAKTIYWGASTQGVTSSYTWANGDYVLFVYDGTYWRIVTCTGTLWLRNGTSNYGSTIRFGDGNYVYLQEDTDDCLKIHTNRLNLDGLATGGLQINGSSGTAGQVLTSNGSGAPTWQTPSGGGGTQWYKHTISGRSEGEYIFISTYSGSFMTSSVNTLSYPTFCIEASGKKCFGFVYSYFGYYYAVLGYSGNASTAPSTTIQLFTDVMPSGTDTVTEL